jgi:chitinase
MVIINSPNARSHDDAALMPDISGRQVLMGFWHNWPAVAGDGYQKGKPLSLELKDVPTAYNLVVVAFMKGAGIPTFAPYQGTDQEFRRQVGILNAQGRPVLISLGGADAHVDLKMGQETAFADEICRLVETYGFDGLDIDLEQLTIGYPGNIDVIPKALKIVKERYRQHGKNFLITMAPEFPYLRKGGKYAPYLEALEGYYDLIAPQYYNQVGDGLTVEGIDYYLAQNNDAVKEDFLYYLTDSIVTGTRNFVKIPADKFAIGLPSNNDAAANGYVIDPQIVYRVFDRLKKAGHPIRGLMTWSVNWDGGQDKHGKSYDWKFSQDYTGLISGNSDVVPNVPPPRKLVAKLNPTSVTLTWEEGVGRNAIARYDITRNGAVLAQTQALAYEDDNILPAADYSYAVIAIDIDGRRSGPSNSVKVRSSGDSTAAPNAPVNLRVRAEGEHSISLEWDSDRDATAVGRYDIYRTGVIGHSGGKTFHDQDLTSDSHFLYYVTAVDAQGHSSVPSKAVAVKTAAAASRPDPDPIPDPDPDPDVGTGGFPEWRVGHRYAKGDGVSYRGHRYVCLNPNLSQVDWFPGGAVTLWRQVD